MTTSLMPLSPAATHQVVEHRDQAVAAFQREALLADVLGVQVALQAFGRGEAVEHALLAGIVQPAVASSLFETAVDPVALLVVADVHELGADRAGVGLLQAGEQVAQLHALAGAGVVAGIELGIQIGIAQAMKGEPQIRRRHFPGQTQRIEVRGKVAARAVCSKQAQHAGLLARMFVADRHGDLPRAALLLRGFDAGNGWRR